MSAEPLDCRTYPEVPRESLLSEFPVFATSKSPEVKVLYPVPPDVEGSAVDSDSVLATSATDTVLFAVMLVTEELVTRADELRYALRVASAYPAPEVFTVVVGSAVRPVKSL